jgi:hypothetical protein
LSSLSNLTQLWIGGTQISNEGLEAISTLANLRNLGIEDCRGISDEGLMHLKNLKSLRDLDVYSCSKLTSSGKEKLKREIPECTING